MLNKNSFKKINTITIGSVLVLILVGSIVRSLGAGMGCPDWPKCFGEYVPPTSPYNLPEDYKEIFRSQRISKNNRIAKVFSGLGYTNLANQILSDPNVQVEQDFDVRKAWIEYINRIIGVLIGLFVFLNMISGLSFWKENRVIPLIGLFIFILTGFQGWVGSLVVSTNLLDGFITFHMVVALLILALLIWQFTKARNISKTKNSVLYYISIVLLVVFIPQIFLGTGVRAVIDEYLFFNTPRFRWIEGLNLNFFIHRSYSWLILIGSISLCYISIKFEPKIKKETFLLLSLVFGSMLAGLGMVKLDFPFLLQSIHMLLATGIFAVLFYLTLILQVNRD